MYEEENTGLTDQSTAPEDLEQTQDEELGQSESTEQPAGIPKKFVGKSTEEILMSYQDLEKDRGRIAEELGKLRKEREELLAKAGGYGSQPMPTQQPITQPQATQELDPFQEFDSSWEDDPKKAIRAALSKIQKSQKQEYQMHTMNQRAEEATKYYWSQREANPDYSRREKLMQQAILEYKDIIRPEYLNSVQTLKLADAISQAMDRKYYEERAVEAAKKGGLISRHEKQRAQSESSSSAGDSTVPFGSLPLEEMEKRLGEVDK